MRLLVLSALTAALVIPLERGGFKYAAGTFYGNVVETVEAASGKPVAGTVSSRLDYYRSALDIIADEPLRGTGLGTWGTVFPRYQGQPQYYSVYAHSFPLQTGAEMGLVGLLLAVGLFCALGWMCRLSLRVTRQKETYVMVAGLTTGLLANTLHSFLDIAWYFPTVTLLFWVEMGLVAAQLKTASIRPGSLATAPRELGNPARVFKKSAVWAVPALFTLLFVFVTLELGENALLRMGDAFRARFSFEAAEGAYLWASRLNPLDAQPFFRLADLYSSRFEESRSQEDLKRGIQFAKRVEGLDPQSSSGYAMLARLYFMGDSKESPMLDEAIGELEKLIKLRRPFQAPYAYRELGRAYLSQGRREDAGGVYLAILESYPQGIYSRQPSHTPLPREELRALLGEAHMALGNIYFEEGNVEAAVVEFEQATDLQPDNPASHFNLGLSYYGGGRVEKALPCFERAIALDARYASSYYYAGLIYKSLGRLEEARKSFERALELEPGYREARESLDDVLDMVGR